MGDLTHQESAGFTKITNEDENYVVGIELIDGKYRLLTSSVTVVDQILGKDDFADSWFRIEDTGDAGDTITVYIKGTSNDPSSPDRDRPDYTKVFTIQAGEVGDELVLRDSIISELNADANFDAYFTASSIKDNAVVHIQSIFRGEFWEVASANDFNVTTSGNASITKGFDNLIRRSKTTSLAADPDNKRVGVLGISGTVTTQPGSIANSLQEYLKNSSSSANTKRKS